MEHQDETKEGGQEMHITSYRDLAGTYLGLVLLTIMTVTISVFGADLYTITVLTALTIASTKAIIVAYNFMHLKYDLKIYRVMIGAVIVLFLVFVVLTLVDYMTRN
jgi:caa(3)-type oxidase subunit IV